MVAGKLLVLARRPGVGIVNVLLVGRGIDAASGWRSCAGTAMRAATMANRTTMREDRVTGPPRDSICDSRRDERNPAGNLRSKPEPMHLARGGEGGDAPRRSPGRRHDVLPHTPEARGEPSWLGEGSGCSSMPTLWRTSAPCTQKMTSSAILVA